MCKKFNFDPDKKYTVMMGGRGQGRSKINLQIISEALERGDDIVILRKDHVDKVKKK